MTDQFFDYTQFLPPQLHSINWREHPLDGKLLLFDRDSGLNLLLEGEETAHLKRIAPRTLLIAVTNICNLDCPFCYRDLESKSVWRYDSLLEFCQQASEWGVLEVAFGGGEPMLFPRWEQFICELYDTTELCINFTTNGMYLTADFLGSIEGKYGNIRLSIYDTNYWQQTIELLVRCNARFGINWMITPDELPNIEQKFLTLFGLGVRDFLLLSYKGADVSMHFDQAQYVEFASFLNRMYRAVGSAAQIKLDVCWENSLPNVPRLFEESDCGAGNSFLSVTSDKQIKPCSFHYWTIPFDTIEDIKQYWQHVHLEQDAAKIAGCARLPMRGLKQIYVD